MSDEYDDDDDQTEPELVSLTKAEHDDLRAKARKAGKADEATTSALAAQRELLFLKSGVDTDTPLGKLLLAGYTGELTAEAIKAEAIAVGALEAPVVDNGPEIPPEESASTEERSTLANGAAVGTAPDADPRATALAVGQQAINAGAQEADGAGLTFRALASNPDLWVKAG